MHKYFIKTPWWAKVIFSDYVWRLPTTDKIVYLSFDDGPHPAITPWVLDQLKEYKAKATFFCIGKNVVNHPETYSRIMKEGHAVGNHTFHHLNGWRTNDKSYVNDIVQAADVINSSLFRPPYGKIKRNQSRRLKYVLNNQPLQVIMWDVLSADFDSTITPQQCTQNVLKHIGPGSIVVFHDSEKAFPNLKQTLPAVLSALKNEGYKFEEIRMEVL